MNTELERRKQEISRTQGRRKLWQRIVSALAAIVMFVTTYVLILPVEAQNRTFCEKEAHEHSAENGCYVETKTLKCEVKHEHTDECYITLLTLICQHEEHIHNKECYADKTADIETQADWEASIKAAKLTGEWSKDIIAIANTQLGYRESDKNYIVNEENEIQGYNRYAAWVSSTNAEFGQYSPWSAAFVAFCLHFAGVSEDAMQRTPYPAQWGELMKAYEKLDADAGNAQPGDILFIDENDDGKADRVAIVVENTDGKIKAVEGDLNNSVAYAEYRLPAAAGDSRTAQANVDFSSEKSTTGRTVGRIIGFVAMPENPNYTAPTPDPNAPGNRINETAAPEATAEPGGDRETAAPTQEPINKTTPEPQGELEAEYNYSLLGKTELPLSKMFAELDIPRSVLLVDSVLSSSPALVGVRRTADDWLISSAVSFTSTEQLSIEFINGEATLIHLTDIPARGIGENYQPGTAEVTAVNVRAVTGTLPFDTDNNPGNDQNATNDVVRSFDTIFYKVGYTLNIIDKYGTAINGFKKANLYIEATLPLTEDKAAFDLDAMPWLTDAQIANSASGQTLTGYYAMDAGSFDYVVPGTGTLSFAVFIKGMANGETVQPSFSIYLDAGEEKSATAQVVRVSAKANYNVEIIPLHNYNANNTFDYQTGAIGSGIAGSVWAFGLKVSVVPNNPANGIRGCYIDPNIDTVSFNVYAAYIYDGQVVNNWANFTADRQPKVWAAKLVNDSVIAENGRNLSELYNTTQLNDVAFLPYSERSLGNEHNSVFNSGGMSAQFIENGGITVTFSGVDLDDAFPTESANGGTQFGKERLLFASGSLHVFMPYSAFQRIGNGKLHRIQATLLNGLTGATQISVNGTAFTDYDRSDADNYAIYEFTDSAPGSWGIGSNTTVPYEHAPGYINLTDPVMYVNLAASRGSEFTYGASADSYTFGGYDRSIYSGDFFIKLPNGIEPGDPSKTSIVTPCASYMFVRTLYVAKADGSGWRNADGWNWQLSAANEMLTYNMTEEGNQGATGALRFFASMEDMRAWNPNAKCVGLWLEARNTTGQPAYMPNQFSDLHYGISINLKLKVSDDAPIGCTQVILLEYRLYGVAYGYNGLDYTRLQNTGIPGTGSTKCYFVSSHGTQPGNYATNMDCFSYVYRPATFNARGEQIGMSYYYSPWSLQRGRVYTATSADWYPVRGGWRMGSSIYVLPEQAEIEKQVAQQTSGLPRSSFFVDNGERSVDYMLSPRIARGGSSTAASYTTVTVTDTLPKGLTLEKDAGQYYCNFGGTYNQPSNRTSSGTVSGDTTVIYAGQTATGIATSATTTGDITFTVTENANGTTTLTWVITNVEVGQEIPKIYYSAHIGNENDPLQDVENTKQLTNTASISTPNSMGVTSSATINIFKLESATLIKRVSTPTPDVNGDVVYTIDYINDSTEKLSSIDILDILPFNNDPRGSSFHGSYTVDTVTVERMNEAAGSYTMGYTTDTAVQSYVGNMYAAGFSPILTPASASVSGMTTTFTLPANTTPTMLAFTGSNVGAGAVIRITVTLHPSGNKHGDIYYNDAAYNTATIPAPVYAVPVSASVVQQHMSLTVTEEIIGGDAGTAFPFTVAVTDGTGNNIYQIPDGDIKVYDAGGNDITPATITRDANGNPIITLGNGDYVEISNIPANYIATVTETGYDGYSVDISGDGTATTTNPAKTQPIVMNGDKTVHYLNERSTVELTITKTVVGAGTGPFGFTVTFTDTNGDPVNIPAPAANSGYTVTNNVATFDLNKDGSVTITGIPVGAIATIVETSHAGYTVQYNFSDGTPSVSGDTAEVTITDDLTVTCINNAGFELPHTGGGGTLILTFSGAVLMATALTYGMAVRRRRERREFSY